MVCEPWKATLDTYLDGELPSDEMRAFDVHVHNCPSCSADALTHLQLKRNIQAIGKRFTPSAEFRKRMQQRIAGKARWNSFGFAWVAATAAIAVLVAVGLTTASNERERVRTEQIYSEVADLHVATLASSSLVDVISTDRHTVKPWFQGKIPFAFDLPELQNSEFSLLGGRMAYLDQTPGAHLIYDVRKHHTSVFVFQERALRLLGRLPGGLNDNSFAPKDVSFNVETWSQGGLRYFVIGDASAADIDSLARLFKDAS
jgi:anti-sigma factor RsiW